MDKIKQFLNWLIHDFWPWFSSVEVMGTPVWKIYLVMYALYVLITLIPAARERLSPLRWLFLPITIILWPLKFLGKMVIRIIIGIMIVTAIVLGVLYYNGVDIEKFWNYIPLLKYLPLDDIVQLIVDLFKGFPLIPGTGTSSRDFILSKKFG